MTNRDEKFSEQNRRALRARIAAAERWARTPDRAAGTVAARQGLRAKFEREVDPDNSLSEAERARRADQLLQAHMMRMSLIAAERRRRRRAG